MLQENRASVVDGHDLVMFDLDGVVYVGGAVIPGVAEHIDRLRREGRHIAFVTNNASRPVDEVAVKLTDMGVSATVEDVVSSAQAAARLLADEYGVGAHIVLLGGDGLDRALRAEGLVPVPPGKPGVALVSGYGKDVKWREIMRAAVLVKDGLPYVATNTDATVPTAYGLAPGHGVLVRTISEFSGVTPTIAGKPARPLMEETIRRVGGARPLMVGDRLDTDIEGANAVGVASLLVLTGVTWLPELAAAPRSLRPTYISPDVGGLFASHPAPATSGGTASLGGWTGEVLDGALKITGEGSVADWWRVAATACWLYADVTGAVANVGDAVPPGPVRGDSAE